VSPATCNILISLTCVCVGGDRFTRTCTRGRFDRSIVARLKRHVRTISIRYERILAARRHSRDSKSRESEGEGLS